MVQYIFHALADTAGIDLPLTTLASAFPAFVAGALPMLFAWPFCPGAAGGPRVK